jgi:hypothetical protein
MEKTERIYFRGKFDSIVSPLEKTALVFSGGLRNQQPSRRVRAVICTFPNTFACLIRAFFEPVGIELFCNHRPGEPLRMKAQRFKEKWSSLRGSTDPPFCSRPRTNVWWNRPGVKVNGLLTVRTLYGVTQPR